TWLAGSPPSTGKMAGPEPSSAARSGSISLAQSAGPFSTIARSGLRLREGVLTLVNLMGARAKVRNRRRLRVVEWQRSGDYEDIWYDTAGGVAKITINRPERRNAFRPTTLFELSHAFSVARDDSSVGGIILPG